jgi:hypothetical protein
LFAFFFFEKNGNFMLAGRLSRRSFFSGRNNFWDQYHGHGRYLRLSMELRKNCCALYKSSGSPTSQTSISRKKPPPPPQKKKKKPSDGCAQSHPASVFLLHRIMQVQRGRTKMANSSRIPTPKKRRENAKESGYLTRCLPSSQMKNKFDCTNAAKRLFNHKLPSRSRQ